MIFFSSVLSMWGYADLCLTIYDYEKYEFKTAVESKFKLLENLKTQLTDNRNFALTKRSALNCTFVVWQKNLMKTKNDDKTWNESYENFTGIKNMYYSLLENSNYSCVSNLMFLLNSNF